MAYPINILAAVKSNPGYYLTAVFLITNMHPLVGCIPGMDQFGSLSIIYCMLEYHDARVKEGTYFFTVMTYNHLERCTGIICGAIPVYRRYGMEYSDQGLVHKLLELN